MVEYSTLAIIVACLCIVFAFGMLWCWNRGWNAAKDEAGRKNDG